ncbi:MAG TPA: enoyl-CoA hydratase-related protein [Candidatus Eisenbacteria bacterium]
MSARSTASPVSAAASEVLLERRGRVLLVTLNRPDSLNALTVSMREPLRVAFADAASDRDVRAVVLTGAGRGFCSGGDIAFMKEVLEKGGDFASFRPLVAAGRDIALAIAACDKPVIAAVNGAAAGGGMGLALSCDVRWASEKAKFAQSYVRLALHPDWGSLYALPRMVGASRALEMMWTGDPVDAAEALRLGIVSRVLPDASLLAETVAFAERLAQGPSETYAEIKRSVREVMGSDLEEVLSWEIDAMEHCWNTRDAREGIAAFLEKRAAKFEGR